MPAYAVQVTVLISRYRGCSPCKASKGSGLFTLLNYSVGVRFTKRVDSRCCASNDSTKTVHPAVGVNIVNMATSGKQVLFAIIFELLTATPPPLVKSCPAQTHRGGTRHIRPLSYGLGLHSILLTRWQRYHLTAPKERLSLASLVWQCLRSRSLKYLIQGAGRRLGLG